MKHQWKICASIVSSVNIIFNRYQVVLSLNIKIYHNLLYFPSWVIQKEVFKESLESINKQPSVWFAQPLGGAFAFEETHNRWSTHQKMR